MIPASLDFFHQMNAEYRALFAKKDVELTKQLGKRDEEFFKIFSTLSNQIESLKSSNAERNENSVSSESSVDMTQSKKYRKRKGKRKRSKSGESERTVNFLI